MTYKLNETYTNDRNKTHHRGENEQNEVKKFKEVSVQ